MVGVRNGELGTVVNRFFEAGAQPSLWPTVLHEASQTFGAEGIVLVPFNIPDVIPVWSEGLDELVEAFVRGNWHVNNARASRFLTSAKPGSISDRLVTESNLFSAEELDRHPFNAELINPLGLRWCIGANLAVQGSGAIIMSIERRVRHGAFSSTELDAVRFLLPHLRLAVQMTMQIAAARAEGLVEGFDYLRCGGILVDNSGRVIHLNSKALRHLGRGFDLKQGRLSADDQGAARQLESLIRNAVQDREPNDVIDSAVVAVPREGSRPLVIYGAPIKGAARDLFQRAKAFLMIVDPDEHRQPALFALQQSFGLTAAESQLATGLMEGHDLQQLARSNHISVATARQHLKSIFAKTETHRQAELVALLARLRP